MMSVQSIFHNVHFHNVRSQEARRVPISILVRGKRVIVFHQVAPLCTK